MLVRLSSKGQLVIPKPVREELGLEPGTLFQIEVEKDRIVLEPMLPSAVDQLYARFADTHLLADLEAEHRRELEDEQVRRA